MAHSCSDSYYFVFYIMIEEMETQTWNLYRYVANQKIFLINMNSIFIAVHDFFCHIWSWLKYFTFSSMPDKPSQIVCMVASVHVTCTQMALHMQKNVCMLLIPLCKNNLNLPMWFFFCPMLGCLHLSFSMWSCLLPLCAALILFVCLFLQKTML